MPTPMQLTVSAGPAPGGVTIGVHGSLDAAAVVALEWVLGDVLADRETSAVVVSLRYVNGVDRDGTSGLGALAARAGEQNVVLTLNDPPEQVCEALQSDGLTELIRMVHQDRRPPWRANEFDRRRARSDHPSGLAR